jgi:hypothetical protein
MAQNVKSMFPGPGTGFAQFAWPKAGMGMPAMPALPAMGEWMRIQQESMAMLAKFSQEAASMLASDMAMGADVARRLMSAKTPEEFVATQRDMTELMGSKYYEQWMKLGEEMKGLFAELGGKAHQMAESAEAVASAATVKKAA